jgi:homoserine/homoserine lactone efflux protein
MSIELYAAFVAACIVLAITPGPNMALFIANSTTHGRLAGLSTVFGSSFGLSFMVAAAALGMNSVMVFVAEWFDLIRWVGAAYLCWLGVTRLRAIFDKDAMLEDTPAPVRNLRRSFWQGCAMSFSNPKVLLFLGAFFPQFIEPTSAIAPQLILMSVTFVLAVSLIDISVVLVFGTAKALLSGTNRRYLDGVSGVVLMGGALWLATMRRA